MSNPAPKVIELNGSTEFFTRLLGGPPDTAGMRSGLVQLEPGHEVGEHSTKDREEFIIVLEGNGSVEFDGRRGESIGPGLAAYCPPQTRHNIVSTGPGVLRYVYVVTPAHP